MPPMSSLPETVTSTVPECLSLPQSPFRQSTLICSRRIQSRSVKPKFYLLHLATTRHARRVVRVVRVAPYLLQRHLTTWHDTHDVLCVSWRDVSRLSCVSRRACSNMEDDEEAVVLACKSFFVFCALNLHQSTENKLKTRRLLWQHILRMHCPAAGRTHWTKTAGCDSYFW